MPKVSATKARVLGCPMSDLWDVFVDGARVGRCWKLGDTYSWVAVSSADTYAIDMREVAAAIERLTLKD